MWLVAIILSHWKAVALDLKYQRQEIQRTEEHVKHHMNAINKIRIMGNCGTHEPLSSKSNCRKKIKTWKSIYCDLRDIYEGQ